MNAPFPSGDLPGYSPSAGYEAPIYDENGRKHDPYTYGWYVTLQRCADTVLGKGLGSVWPEWWRVFAREPHDTEGTA